jgi:hypothetical protein
MPALLTADRRPETERIGERACGGGPTLEEVLGSAWRQLQAGLSVACAVCGGRMEPEPSARGHCRDCGTTLS